jgi:transcriptional regulator with XRE-family HTH domain
MGVRKTRLQQKLTQEQLAERSGIHVTDISHLERGNRNPGYLTMLRVSSGLGVPLSELVSTIQEIEVELES